MPALPLAPSRALPGMRTMSAARAALHARLGGGCSLLLWPGRDPDQQIRMTLYAADPDDGADWDDALLLHVPCGAFQLSSGVRWLRALSGIDLGEPGQPLDPWLCAALLGALDGTPLEAGSELARAGVAPDDAVVLRWVLHSRHHSVACHARASAGAWSSLLARADWHRAATPLTQLAALPVRTSVVVARHTLAHAAAFALRPGDIILPDSPAFDCAGQGRIRLAGQLLTVAWHAPSHLDILDLESAMDQYDPEAGVVTLPPSDFDTREAGHPAPGLESDALTAVPVRLDFVLGRIELPLARLQQLAAGSVLELHDGSPLDVAIDCGGRLLGRAELLDVEGRLGLRVTHWMGAA